MARAAGSRGTKNNRAGNKPDDTGDAGNADSGVVGASTGAAPEPPPIDPATVEPNAPDDSADSRPRRGRPPGATAKAKTLPLNVTGLEKLLVGIHGGIAILSGRDEWSLDTSSRIFDGKTEAEFFAHSVKDVSDHYGNGLLDKKTLDWANLIQCLAIIYIGRWYAIRSTPKIRVPKQTPVPAHRAGPEPTMHQPAKPNDVPTEENLRTGNIPGVGGVVFPPDHPLFRKMN